MRQPVAMDCRETLISNVLSLDWKIEPIDSEQRDELKDTIKYYTKLFTYNGDYDYSEIIEWIGRDLLDLPFGGAAEIGREGDDPTGKVLWINLLDGGTLFPSLNQDYPVGQRIKEFADATVYFPYYAIARVYMSPRTEIKRWGWGMPPPEKIYLALEMLNRGDIYYAGLMLDTPQVGVLDLMDMSKDSAEKWIDSWKTLLGGVDPFKIPVLYEHEKKAEFIPFTRSPTEIMFDSAVAKYAALVASGYGMSLSDIGYSAKTNGGETLAGTIRQERQTRRTGLTRVKRKLEYFFDKILPEELYFKFIDLDDEQSVAKGRARLADATAWAQYIDKGMFTAQEARLQVMADGLVTISIPEEIPPEAAKAMKDKLASPERPSMLGRPIAPSSGGQGEVLQSLLDADPEFRSFFTELEEKFPGLGEDEQQNVLKELKNYLEQMTNSAKLLDRELYLDNN
jgi:hypothetical protein